MKRQLHNTLDNERWVHCDTNVERQHDIEQLASGRAFLQKKKVVAVSVSVDDDSPTVDMNNGTTSDSKVNNIVIKKKETRPTNVEGSFYKASWSSLFVTEICLQYLNIAVSFPTIGTEVITKTAEILRLFDKRTRELVLAAEAIESAARLKSISAKHLAITSQSLGLVLALLPHFRAALLAQLPPSHHMQLTELDRVVNLLIEHHGLIVDKLVEIAAYAVDSSSNGLRKVDWDIFQGQCDYFVEVTRNVSALHRVLQEILPSEQIQDIFSRIFASLCRKMPAHFEDIMPDTHTGKQRILDEVTHLVSSLIRLKQVSIVIYFLI
jgi:vacuolar protein sorting-associated protein 54